MMSSKSGKSNAKQEAEVGLVDLRATLSESSDAVWQGFKDYEGKVLKTLLTEESSNNMTSAIAIDICEYKDCFRKFPKLAVKMF